MLGVHMLYAQHNGHRAFLGSEKKNRMQACVLHTVKPSSKGHYKIQVVFHFTLGKPLLW